MADHGRGAWTPPPFLIASAGLHGVALATAVMWPGSWGLAVASVIANHVAIGAASMTPRSSLLGPNLTRLPAGAGAKIVALTFDDGPDPEVTPAVLEMLRLAGARATFFCVGRRAEAHPGLIDSMRAAGHGVENHTYRHPNAFALFGPRALEREICRGQRALAGGNESPRFFRSPAGMQSPWLGWALAKHELSLVSWTRRGFDTVSRSGARVAARLCRGLHPGDIMLLHDGSSARDGNGRPIVLEALPRLLDRMGAGGLRSEALHRVLGPS